MAHEQEGVLYGFSISLLTIIDEAIFMNKCIIICVIVVSISVCPFAFAGEYEEWVQKLNIPTWVRNVFQEKGLITKYDYSFKINPLYLRGDFNGDNSPDIAMLITENSSNKLGIIVIHFGINDTFILGAGNIVGNGGDDFKWMSNWAVKRKEKVGQGADDKPPPTLIGEALYVEKAESASAIIYWDGMKYIWYQQSD